MLGCGVSGDMCSIGELLRYHFVDHFSFLRSIFLVFIFIL